MKATGGMRGVLCVHGSGGPAGGELSVTFTVKRHSESNSFNHVVGIYFTLNGYFWYHLTEFQCKGGKWMD